MERLLLLGSTLLPLAGAAACLQSRAARRAAWVSLTSSLGIWVAAFLTSSAIAEPQIATSWEWLPSAQIKFLLGLDGLNLPWAILMATAFPVLFLFRGERLRESFWANALLLFAQSMALISVISLDLLSYVAASTALGLAALAFGSSYCADRTGSTYFWQGLRVGLGGVMVLLCGLVLYQTTQPRTLSFWELEPELAPAIALALLSVLLVGSMIRSPLRISEERGPATANALLSALSAMIAWFGAFRFSLSALPEALSDARPWILALGGGLAVGAALLAWVRARQARDVAAALKCLLLSHLGVLLVALGLHERMALTGGLILSWSVPMGWIAIYALRPWPTPALFALPILASFSGVSLLLYGAYLDQVGYPILAALVVATMASGLLGWELLKRQGRAAASSREWAMRLSLLVFLVLLGIAGVAPGALVDRVRPTVALLLTEKK